MKKTGKILLIIGAVSLFILILPESVYNGLNFGANFVRFINNYLIIIGIFLVSAGVAAMVAGKKRSSTTSGRGVNSGSRQQQ